MKARVLLSVAAIAVMVTASVAAPKVSLKGVKCVMNPKMAAKAKASVDFKGAKVYFCCGNCAKAFTAKQKDPKVATKGNHQLVATKQVKQAKCPLTGGKLNPATKIKVQGAELAFCCNMCKGKANKAKGADQLALVFSDKAFKKAGFAVPKKKAKK
ncbi:MAG: hypothetical protein CMJ59_06790 [Planctomycetaceae bacterium]|nr:hypothetical protein [Planctomycetaceae bacterium]